MIVEPGGDKCATALPGHDQAALAEHRHGVAERLVGHAEPLSDVPLSGQPLGVVASLDGRRDSVGRPARVLGAIFGLGGVPLLLYGAFGIGDILTN